jgi:hypothetical protein
MHLVRKTGTADLSSVALSLTTDHPGKSRLLQVLLRASAAISETVTVTWNSKDGTSYSVVLDTTNLSSAQNYVFRPTGDCVLEEGDTITITCTKANNTGIVYATIILQDLGKR